MTRSRGFGTSQTSLTPSDHTWGSRPSASWNALIAAPVRCPHVPSASTVALAVTSDPGSKLDSSSPSFPRPLAQTLHHLRLLGQQLKQSVRAGQPGRTPADDHHADFDPFVFGVELALDEFFRRGDGRRVFGGCDAAVAVGGRAHDPLRSLMASVSLGRILFRSPTIPRS